VDGTRKWSAGDDWFYTIEEKKWIKGKN
jgi:hypothetical protein